MATKKSETTVRPERGGRDAAAESKGAARPAAAGNEIAKALADLAAQVTALTERLAKLEAAAAPAQGPPPASAPLAPSAGQAEEKAQPPPQAAPSAPGLSEEEILAISAALGAFFGVRMRIRQIRLLSSQAWAQVGRVSIQASHRLHN